METDEGSSKSRSALTELKRCPGSRSARKRVGRGNASGNGRTAGRGEKGQQARSGYRRRAGFEGGQMPLYRRIPKVGFQSRKRLRGLNCYAIVRLSDLEQFEDGAVVDPEVLAAAGLRQRHLQRAGLKLLANGSLSKRLTVRVHAASEAAAAAVAQAGGTVEILKQAAVNAEPSGDSE